MHEQYLPVRKSRSQHTIPKRALGDGRPLLGCQRIATFSTFRFAGQFWSRPMACVQYRSKGFIRPSLPVDVSDEGNFCEKNVLHMSERHNVARCAAIIRCSGLLSLASLVRGMPIKIATNVHHNASSLRYHPENRYLWPPNHTKTVCPSNVSNYVYLGPRQKLSRQGRIGTRNRKCAFLVLRRILYSRPVHGSYNGWCS